MLRMMKRLMRDQEAATAVEYALLCAMLFLAIMATVNGLASETNTMWTKVSSTMAAATA